MTKEKNVDDVYNPHECCAGDDCKNTQNNPQQIFFVDAVDNTANAIENFNARNAKK
jgi:hypothetical protein